MKTFKKTIIATALVSILGNANATIQTISTDKFNTLYIDKTNREVLAIGGSEFFNESGKYAIVNQNIPIPYGVGNAKSVVTTSYRSYVLKNDGTVFASGREFGKIPVNLNVSNVDDLSANNTTILLLKNGTVYEYDINNSSETINEYLPTNIVEISSGHYHNVALTSDGIVYTWGYNKHGQLGNGTYDDNVIPEQIYGIPKIANISTSMASTVLTSIDGEVFTIGKGLSGMAGNNGNEDTLIPFKLDLTSPAKKGYAGNTQTIILYDTGNIKTVGWHNYIGADVNGIPLYNQNYELVELPELKNITELDASGDHKMFINSDNVIVGWGSGGNGQLGNGKNIETHYPEVIQVPEYPGEYSPEYDTSTSCEIKTEYVEVIKEVPVIQYVEVIKEVTVIQYVEVIKDNNGHGDEIDQNDTSNPGKKYK